MRNNIIKVGGNNIVNRCLEYAIGNNEAKMYDIFLYKHEYWKSMNKLKDGYFYITTDDLIRETNLGKHVIENCIKRLVDLKLILKKQMDMPRKNYYSVVYNIEYQNKLLEDGRIKMDKLSDDLRNKNIDSKDRLSKANESPVDTKQLNSVIENSSTARAITCQQHDIESVVTNNLSTNNLPTNNKEPNNPLYGIPSTTSSDFFLDNPMVKRADKNFQTYLKKYFEVYGVDKDTNIDMLLNTWNRSKDFFNDSFTFLNKHSSTMDHHSRIVDFFFEEYDKATGHNINFLFTRQMFANYFESIYKDLFKDELKRSNAKHMIDYIKDDSTVIDDGLISICNSMFKSNLQKCIDSMPSVVPAAELYKSVTW